ncbi:hypothetical protein [Ancylomarina longa]|uniref:SPOR domain-containing protein n=1 Tax=Ancylomarina longa TaxID=2487017 RepID=A0A434AUM8_9BACT|nr:hypothetical protein [Ancylomarina longa]RUT78134.1 hypothetical protein DLK05_09820 [Ancylomarina longa]
MKYRKLFLGLAIVLSGLAVVAQNSALTFKVDSQIIKKDSLGTVNIIQDDRVNELLKTDSTINSKNLGFTGYRIQIFSGRSTDKEKAVAVKNEFLQLFPTERAYVVYSAPDFRVRVGNFRTKLESIALFKACEKYFPNCYPVKTRITFADLEPLKIKDSENPILEEE